jgi:hypothetical protein
MWSRQWTAFCFKQASISQRYLSHNQKNSIVTAHMATIHQTHINHIRTLYTIHILKKFCKWCNYDMQSYDLMGKNRVWGKKHKGTRDEWLTNTKPACCWCYWNDVNSTGWTVTHNAGRGGNIRLCKERGKLWLHFLLLCVLAHLLVCCYDSLHLVLKFQIPTPRNLQSQRNDKVCYPAPACLSSEHW